MVKALALVLLTACSVEGVVLVVVPGAPDASLDAEAARDADVVLDVQAPPLDAQPEAAIVEAALAPVGVCRIGSASDGFYDSFPDGPLDARWLVADGVQSFASFRREQVAVTQGTLVLTATPEAGAAIVTRDLFGSATYQVQGRVSDGAQLSVWWRRDDDADGTIQIASPGQGGNFSLVQMRTHDGTASSENQFALGASLNDGSDHILRFDRYTTASPSTAFWVDDQPRWSATTSLPTSRAGRLWIVAWPRDPDFDSAVIRITNAFVTPFGNSGDRCTDGELSGPGLLPP